MKRPRHRITDHALLRYFERGHGVDIEQLRRELGRELDRAYDKLALGADMSPTAIHLQGLSFMVDKFTVLTVKVGSFPNTVRSDD